MKRAAGLGGEAEGTGTSGEDLLPNASLPFELQNHRCGTRPASADSLPLLLRTQQLCAGLFNTFGNMQI